MLLKATIILILPLMVKRLSGNLSQLMATRFGIFKPCMMLPTTLNRDSVNKDFKDQAMLKKSLTDIWPTGSLT